MTDPPNSPLVYDTALIDDDRQIRFHAVGTLSRGSIYVFRLTWRDVRVAVSASLVPDGYEQSDEHDYINIRFNGAGTATSYDIPPFAFSSREQEARTMLIAAECLVTYGYFGDGLTAPIGKYGVRTNGERRTLHDFGCSS